MYIFAGDCVWCASFAEDCVVYPSFAVPDVCFSKELFMMYPFRRTVCGVKVMEDSS